MPSQIAYFINEYPKVSHSFIRREILALERQGFDVLRISLRGWNSELVDAEDRQERTRTRYVLQRGVVPLAVAILKALLSSPGKFFSALSLACKMGKQSDRPLHYHLIYLAEACQVLSWLKAFDAKHVHAHFGTNSAEVVMLARALGGPPYSFTVHGPEEFDKPVFIGLAEKVKHSAFVVAITSFCRSQIYRWIQREQWSKIHVVHCGLEPAFHEVAPGPFPLQPRLVCVARLSEEKGQLLLIEAAARLAKKGLAFELVLAGDGKLRAEIETLIQKFSLQNHVRITGWIDSQQVREEILAARALVQPSFAEGLPVVVMEGMALRRPVLTTYIAGIPELVVPGKTGWLIPAGSIDELATAMESLLMADPEHLKKMGDEARLRALERHSVDIEAAKLAELFRCQYL